MRRTLALGFAIALACLVSPARADDTVASYRAEHGVFANLGLYSALGYGGLSYGYAPLKNLVLEAGVGFGYSGAQLSFMPKLVLGKTHRLLLGIGPSLGILDLDKGSLWLNSEIGYEFRSSGGFAIALVAGWTQGLAGCAEKSCRPGGAAWGDESSSRAWNSQRAVDLQGPQGRIIVGYWF